MLCERLSRTTANRFVRPASSRFACETPIGHGGAPRVRKGVGPNPAADEHDERSSPDSSEEISEFTDLVVSSYSWSSMAASAPDAAEVVAAVSLAGLVGGQRRVSSAFRSTDACTALAACRRPQLYHSHGHATTGQRSKPFGGRKLSSIHAGMASHVLPQRATPSLAQKHLSRSIAESSRMHSRWRLSERTKAW